MQTELEFLTLAEKIKKEMRHSWLSDGIRQESVAEHSWRLALMVLRYSDKLDEPVNTEKCLKMAIIHDLAEAKAGDIPVFHCQTLNAKNEKFKNEHAAMLEIKALLNDKSGNEIYDLWIEFEDQKSYESKFIKALDKLEVFIQHNEAPLSTWEDREKRMIFQSKWLIKHCEFDSYLKNLCSAVINQAIKKLEVAGENIIQIKKLAEDEEKSWAREIAY